jgi:hypothetical protein
MENKIPSDNNVSAINDPIFIVHEVAQSQDAIHGAFISFTNISGLPNFKTELFNLLTILTWQRNYYFQGNYRHIIDEVYL